MNAEASLQRVKRLKSLSCVCLYHTQKTWRMLKVITAETRERDKEAIADLVDSLLLNDFSVSHVLSKSVSRPQQHPSKSLSVHYWDQVNILNAALPVHG